MLPQALRTTYEERLTKKRAYLSDLEVLRTNLLLGGPVKSYTLNTGQTVQTVTRHDLPAVEALITQIEREIDDLTLKLDGVSSRVVIAKPGF